MAIGDQIIVDQKFGNQICVRRKKVGPQKGSTKSVLSIGWEKNSSTDTRSESKNAKICPLKGSK